MTARWDGGRASGRTSIRRGGSTGQWTISGEQDTAPASGTDADMIRLARMILENIPDLEDLPLDQEALAQALPDQEAAALDNMMESVRETVRDDGRLNPEQRAWLGGALMAAGIHLIQTARANARGNQHLMREPTPLPFGLRLAPEFTRGQTKR